MWGRGLSNPCHNRLIQIARFAIWNHKHLHSPWVWLPFQALPEWHSTLERDDGFVDGDLWAWCEGSLEGWTYHVKKGLIFLHCQCLQQEEHYILVRSSLQRRLIWRKGSLQYHLLTSSPWDHSARWYPCSVSQPFINFLPGLQVSSSCKEQTSWANVMMTTSSVCTCLSYLQGSQRELSKKVRSNPEKVLSKAPWLAKLLLSPHFSSAYMDPLQFNLTE